MYSKQDNIMVKCPCA